MPGQSLSTTVEGLTQRWNISWRFIAAIFAMCMPLMISLQAWLVAQTYGIVHRVGLNEYKIEEASREGYTKLQADLDNAQQTAFLLEQIRVANKETLLAIQELAEDIKEIDRRSVADAADTGSKGVTPAGVRE